MSWNTFHITLNPNASTGFGYTWHDDHGPQYAEPREFTGSTRGNRLRVTDSGTIRNNDDTMTYFVWVTNDGPNVASFELMGGGL